MTLNGTPNPTRSFLMLLSPEINTGTTLFPLPSFLRFGNETKVEPNARASGADGETGGTGPRGREGDQKPEIWSCRSRRNRRPGAAAEGHLRGSPGSPLRCPRTSHRAPPSPPVSCHPRPRDRPPLCPLSPSLLRSNESWVKNTA